jgi:hypothetical protein
MLVIALSIVAASGCTRSGASNANKDLDRPKPAGS